MKSFFLSVIIPCFNEERNIRLGVLESVAHFLERRKYSYEVVLVDDGSTDGSVTLIQTFLREHAHFRLLCRKHRGKAAAVTAGMFEAKGDIILFTDLDQATPIHQIDVLLPLFSNDRDVVIGSRNTVRRGAPLFRRAMARGFMWVRNIILDVGIGDTQCGFKAFTRSAARDIFSHLQVYGPVRKASGSTVTAGFDVELLYLAKLLGYTIAEVPVEWHYQETRHINPLRDSLESIIALFSIRWKSIRGAYSIRR